MISWSSDLTCSAPNQLKNVNYYFGQATTFVSQWGTTLFPSIANVEGNEVVLLFGLEAVRLRYGHWYTIFYKWGNFSFTCCHMYCWKSWRYCLTAASLNCTGLSACSEIATTSLDTDSALDSTNNRIVVIADLLRDVTGFLRKGRNAFILAKG